MLRLRRTCLRFLSVFFIMVFALGPTGVLAAPNDYETVGGHFFGQAGGQSGFGFGVSDVEGAAFWQTYRDLGGAELLGVPISRRFNWNGRATQVFQRGVLQYEPLEKRVVALNVMDTLNVAGRDPWLLSTRSVPTHLKVPTEQGKTWTEIVSSRQALLEAQPQLRDFYFGAANPIAAFGLPTSTIQDMGSHFAIRTQRGVLQLWKQDMPFATSGEVTASLVGEFVRDSGLIQSALGPAGVTAFTPEVAWQAAPPPPPPAPVQVIVNSAVRPDSIGPGERWIDVNLSRQWLTTMQGDQAAYGAPITSGKSGWGTPTGTFHIFSRVPNETMDSATLGIPRGSSEGYFLKDIRYTQYFAGGGYAIHTNYWQPNSVFGVSPTSHGCIGMRVGDARVVWDFADFGTAVYIHY